MVNRFRAWFRKHHRLVKRRGGIISHIKLERRFREIDRDPYVAMTREKLKRGD